MLKETRFACHPKDVSGYNSKELRKNFLIEKLFVKDQINLVHSLYDRMIVLGCLPIEKPILLDPFSDITKADSFLERRELGIINVGSGEGIIKVDEENYTLDAKDALYVGKGKYQVSFESKDKKKPAKFYMVSYPAHKEYPTEKASKSDANPVHLGDSNKQNERTIYQYIHEKGIQSCQLVMGFTELKKGSNWNTFPPHTHIRRMEVYYYFDLPEDQLVIHLMGEPSDSKHLIVRNEQAIISPEWSIHCGVGSSPYNFIWAMGGENQSFNDMDPVDSKLLF